MSDVSPEVPAAPDAPADGAAPADPKPTETVEFWKEKARENERRAKSNADKAKEYDAFQESQKTEQQKIADRALAAERERDAARAESLRYKAAATHKVGEDYFDLLGDGDEETILGRAQRVGSLIAERDQLKAELEALRNGAPPSTGRPIEQLKPGATPANSPLVDDSYPASWFPSRTARS